MAEFANYAALLSAAAMLPVGLAQAPAARADGLAPYRIEAGGIAEPLGGRRGDAARGRTLVVDRQKGLCLLCHAGPFPEQRFQGDIAPDLAGVGARIDEAGLRLRMVDGRHINPGTIMPPYHALDGLERVGQSWRGRPIFSAEQIEDVVAFLVTLQEETR